jgi:hypothetical protein
VIDKRHKRFYSFILGGLERSFFVLELVMVGGDTNHGGGRLNPMSEVNNIKTISWNCVEGLQTCRGKGGYFWGN